jgi:hypothetical protein
MGLVLGLVGQAGGAPSRLFHAIVLCGAAFAASCGAAPLGDSDEDDAAPPNPATAEDGNATEAVHEQRCRLPDGGCHEHCTALPGDRCLDPCFVHTTECSPDCLELDGSCGWPPTK